MISEFSYLFVVAVSCFTCQPFSLNVYWNRTPGFVMNPRKVRHKKAKTEDMDSVYWRIWYSHTLCHVAIKYMKTGNQTHCALSCWQFAGYVECRPLFSVLCLYLGKKDLITFVFLPNYSHISLFHNDYYNQLLSIC